MSYEDTFPESDDAKGGTPLISVGIGVDNVSLCNQAWLWDRPERMQGWHFRYLLHLLLQDTQPNHLSCNAFGNKHIWGRYV